MKKYTFMVGRFPSQTSGIGSILVTLLWTLVLTLYSGKAASAAIDAQTILSPIKQKSDLLQDTINQPRLVRPEADGTLRLSAETGRAIGPDIKYMPEWRAFGWFTAADRVEWEAEVKKGGTYEVYLDWSVSDVEAGKPFLFVAGKRQLQGVVGRTGSWETFKTEKIGRVRLSPGRHKMVFKPNSSFEKGALLDLREVRLVPVK
jgi:hypothetical protein